MRTPKTPLALIAIALAACGQQPTKEPSETAPNATATKTIPASLAPFGEGYPKAGDACRRLGESDATRNYLDDTTLLVGCPTAEVAKTLGGTIVTTIEGITLVAVPDPARGDALVPGTAFNATADIACSADGAEPKAQCKAGVRRNAGPDGTTFVEVTKPNGSPRVLFFKDGKATGADGAQADGSAGFTFKAERKSDDTHISYGPERYVVPDALVIGG